MPLWNDADWPANHGRFDVPQPTHKSALVTAAARAVAPKHLVAFDRHGRHHMPSPTLTALAHLGGPVSHDRGQALQLMAHRMNLNPGRDMAAHRAELTRKTVPSAFHGTPHAPPLLERLGLRRVFDVAPNAVHRGLVYHP